MSKQQIEQAKEKLLSLLEKDDLESIARSYTTGMDVDEDAEVIPSMNWSFRNQLIMRAHGHLAAAGFKQWKQFERYVQKGENAFHILAPKIITEEVEKENDDGETVTEEVTKCVGFLSVPVFGFDQTDGEDLDFQQYAPDEFPPLMDVAEKWDIDVSYLPPSAEGLRGWHNPEKDQIVLQSHDDGVFFHELAHAAHKRLDDWTGSKDYEEGSSAYKELVAETTAGVLCVMYGIEGYAGNIQEYLEEYNEDGSAKDGALKVLGTVEDCLDLILETADEREETMIT